MKTLELEHYQEQIFQYFEDNDFAEKSKIVEKMVEMVEPKTIGIAMGWGRLLVKTSSSDED